jgi:hypothetical protein
MKSTLSRSRARKNAEARTPRPARAPAPPLAIQALEPRVLLDAAAAQTVQETAQIAEVALPAESRVFDDLVDALSVLDNQDAAQPQPAAVVYFIDRSVPEAEQLIASMPPGAQVHLIAADTDGVAYVARMMQGRTDVSAVHILGHGDDGALRLGSARLTLESMQGEHREALAAIGRALAEDADILIYGCDFGAGEAGARAVETLGSLTGADIAASDDATGAARFGGDWALEVEAGEVEAQAFAAPEWDHLMAPAILSISTNAVANGSFENTTAWTQQTGGAAEMNSATVFGLGSAFDGTRVVEVEGAIGSRYIEQTVGGLVAGQTYTLSWYGHTRPTSSSGGNDLGSAIVYEGTTELALQQFETRRTGWQRYTMTFVAPTSGTVNVVFLSRGNTVVGTGSTDADSAGLLLDAVRLQRSPDHTTSYTENAAAVAIASADSALRDADSTNQSSLRVRITNADAGDLLSVSGSLPAGITANYDAATATLTLSGSSSNANYLTALRAVRYSSTSDTPSSVTRVLEVVVNDGSADSNTAVSRVAVVPQNDAPVLSTTPNLAYTAQEDAPAPANGTAVGVAVSTYTGGITDADAAPQRGIAITGNAPTNGVWWYRPTAGRRGSRSEPSPTAARCCWPTTRRRGSTSRPAPPTTTARAAALR